MALSTQRIPRRRGALLVLLLIYLAFLIKFTLTPFEFAADPSLSIIAQLRARFEWLTLGALLNRRDGFFNVLLFVPFGALLNLLCESSIRTRGARVLVTLTVAVLFSLGLELTQVFLPRRPTMTDVVFNVVGAFVGIGLVMWRPANWQTHYLAHATGWRLAAASIYAPAVVAGFTIPHVRTDFRNWSPNFPLQLGNEATMDRPWLGKIFLAAVFDSSLSADEVQMRFEEGPFRDREPGMRPHQPVVLYTFREAVGRVVRDRSLRDPSADLYILDTNRVTWLEPAGIDLREPTALAHANPIPKLTSGSIRGGRELTLEAWIEPANLEQRGPARIISHSETPNGRNFTLGQEGQGIVFRIRTPLTGTNGVRPQLEASGPLVTTSLHHVVATYHENIMTVFVDGREREQLVLTRRASGDISSWLDGVFGRGSEWFYAPVVLFPLGVLLYLQFAIRIPSVIRATTASVAVGLAILLFIEFMQTVWLRTQFDWGFIRLGLVAIASGALGTVLLAPNPRAVTDAG